MSNREYIDRFLDYLGDVRGYSEKTVISYRHDLLRLDDFMQRHGLEIKDFTPEDAMEFVSELYVQKLAGSSINRILSANRSFFHEMYSDGTVNCQPFARISRARQGQRIPSVLSEQELDSLLNYPGDDYQTVMETTMFNLFYSTGCRLSELLSVRLNDIDLKSRRIKVMGKGSKERFVFLTQKALEKLESYLVLRKEKAEITGSDILLLNKKGLPLPLSTVHIIFDRYGEKLGITKKFTPHVLRHTFATDMLDADSDIRIVQALLGHESIGTTQIYTHVTGKRLEKVYRNSHPHGRKQ